MRVYLGRALGVLGVCLIMATEAKAQAPHGSSWQGMDSSQLAPRAVAVPDSARAGARSVELEYAAVGLGPTVQGVTVGVEATRFASSEMLTAVQQERSTGSSKALMIVGGAAFLAGLIIGDDAGSVLAV